MAYSIPDLYAYFDKVLDSVSIINTFRKPTQCELNSLRSKLHNFVTDPRQFRAILRKQNISTAKEEKLLVAMSEFIDDFFKDIYSDSGITEVSPQCRYLADQLKSADNNTLSQDLNNILCEFLLDTSVPSSKAETCDKSSTDTYSKVFVAETPI